MKGCQVFKNHSFDYSITHCLQLGEILFWKADCFNGCGCKTKGNAALGGKVIAPHSSRKLINSNNYSSAFCEFVLQDP